MKDIAIIFMLFVMPLTVIAISNHMVNKQRIELIEKAIRLESLKGEKDHAKTRKRDQ